LIDQKTVKWQPLPTIVLSVTTHMQFYRAEYGCVCSHPMDKDFLVTGVQLVETNVKRDAWYGWPSETALSLKIFRQKFDLKSGKLLKEVKTDNLISENQKLQSLDLQKKDVTIHTDKLFQFYTEVVGDNYSYLRDEVFLDADDISLKSPITTVGLMHYNRGGGFGRLRPFVTSINYSGI
jgi:hypothetical protein